MNRRHDIDALRVIAFGLLILYHVGMFYVAEWGWHVKSAYQAEWLQTPMLLSNQWRMPLIFLISGLAVNFVMGKYSAGRFALRRIWRLGLPLLFGMAFIVPPQAYFEALGKGVIEPGFLDFMAQYLTFQDFPAEAWDGVEIATWTWNHLWYLPYLLCYTLVLIPIAILLDGPAAPVRKAFQGLRRTWLLLLPLVPLMLYGNFIFPHFPYVSHALIGDWYAHAQFFTFFFYGFLIGRDKAIWAEFARLRWLAIALAVVAFAAVLIQRALFVEGSGFWAVQASAFIIYFNRWIWIVAVLGWGHHWLKRPMPWLPYATEAVYPWYILHQTIIVVAGVCLSRLALGSVTEPALVLVATIGGCFVLHEYVIRRTPILRPLFGLSYRPSGLTLAAAAGKATPAAANPSSTR
jgi:peptidoglycan/LPS O-acetylase OafA/YrhL